jgi:hypothetical protein
MDPKKHFVMTISAPRGSGKSFLVKSLLRSGLDQHFKHVVVMNPSIDLNDDYKEYLNNDRYTLIPNFSEEDIDDLFTKQSDCMRRVRRRERDPLQKHLPKLSCPRTLLILDDVIDSGVISFRGGVDRIAERGRHINMSLIICSQRISAISRSIRLNSDYFIIFSPHSIGETEQYLEQFVSRQDRKKVREMMSVIFDEDFTFIVLDNSRKMTEKLRWSKAQDFIRGKTKLIQLGEPNGKRRKLNEDE